MKVYKLKCKKCGNNYKGTAPNKAHHPGLCAARLKFLASHSDTPIMDAIEWKVGQMQVGESANVADAVKEHAQAQHDAQKSGWLGNLLATTSCPGVSYSEVKPEGEKERIPINLALDELYDGRSLQKQQIQELFNRIMVLEKRIGN